MSICNPFSYPPPILDLSILSNEIDKTATLIDIKNSRLDAISFLLILSYYSLFHCLCHLCLGAIIIDMNKNKISYNKYVAEIIGALILVLVVALSGSGLSVIIFAGIAYAFIVYLFGDISGAHANPAFTLSALTMRKIKWQDAVLYICAQLIGAGIALIILKNIPGFTFTNINTIEGLTVWTIFKSEVIGTAIFAMAFSAMIHGKTTKSNVGFVAGVGLFFGLLFANMAGGVGVLNPAVAVGANLLNWATIVGPIVGALIGAWLYRFIAVGNLCGCNSSCDDSCYCGFCHRKAKNNESEPITVVVEEIEVIN